MSRLSEIVVGLQRMGEAAQNRGADILYAQQVEVHEHLRWLDDQLNMVEKVRQVLLTERRKFIPVEKQQVEQQPMPRQLPTGREQSPVEMSAARKPV